MSIKQVALQLYSLREDAAEDFPAVLKQVADMGYSGVEFAGYGGLSAKDLKNMLADLGLVAVGSHVGYNLLTEELEKVIEYNLEIGNKRIVCPGAPKELTVDKEGWHKFANILNELGEKFKNNNLEFGFHNHSREFVEYDGEYALDIFFAETDPRLVFAELDLGWVYYAKVDPVKYMKKYQGRCPLVHIKDFLQDGDQVEVGTGDIDLASIVKNVQQVGVEHLIIETEKYTMHPVESVKVGLTNLKKVLDKELA